LSDTEANQDILRVSNAIILGGPTSNSFARVLASQFPVRFASAGFELGPRYFSDPKTGIIFLSRCGQEIGGLCTVLDGTDEAGLRKAVNGLPLLSNINMPDYAVLGPRWGQAGVAGLLAAGYWDNSWKYSAATGYVSSV